MKREGTDGLIGRLKTDYAFRALTTAIFSSCFTLIFAAYNVVLGILYRAAWNFGISVYYAMLALLRIIAVFGELRDRKRQPPQNGRGRGRYLAESILLFLLDVALIAPLAMMVKQERHIAYHEITAISIAAYTALKITFAIVNYKKTRKTKDLTVRMLKNINFKDALVSILLLQYALVMTFGEGMRGDMLTVSQLSSAALWGFLIAISALSLRHAAKIFRDPSTE